MTIKQLRDKLKESEDKTESAAEVFMCFVPPPKLYFSLNQLHPQWSQGPLEAKKVCQAQPCDVRELFDVQDYFK